MWDFSDWLDSSEIKSQTIFFLQRNPEVTDDNCCECMKTLITADGPTTADRCATARTPKTVITESLQRREKNCLEFNKAINKKWEWPFQDGTWNFVFFYTFCRFSTQLSPNESSFSALQPDSCPKSKAANMEPEGWCLLICRPSNLYHGVKRSVF